MGKVQVNPEPPNEGTLFMKRGVFHGLRGWTLSDIQATSQNYSLDFYREVNKMAYCHSCDRSFSTRSALLQHLENSPNHPGYCDDCEEDFFSRQALIEHYDESPNHFYCGTCDERFDDEDELEEHKNDSHFYCGFCSKFFSTQNGQRSHNRQKHSYCDTCDEAFKDEDDLEDHYESEHNYCWLCSRFFVNANGARSHKRQKHSYCEECDEVFDDNDDLEEHNDEQHWYCRSCKRFFESKSNRDHHLRSSIHRSSKFACPGRKCKRTFISESALILHCESGTCPSGVTRHKINRAVTILDSKNIITNPNRLLRDSEEHENCEYRATRRSWNGAAYECYLCHKQFAKIGSLNSHLNSPAHEASIYRCPSQWGGCNQGFPTLSGLFGHVESECCGVRKFQKKLRNAIGSLEEGLKRLTL